MIFLSFKAPIASFAQSKPAISAKIGFIQENCHDVNFTVQIMADHFDMSLTNISQYFKTHTGQTIIDYIATLRITKAKDMLINSDMSVNEIAQSVGYLSASSFIRRFKQITGLTPIQYVKENKTQK